jgi:hypothetical protein
LETYNLNIYNKNNMAFSWNKWRQYIIEEASVNEEVDEVGEIIPFFHDAMKMDLIRSIDYQRAVEAGGESEDLDAFESTQEFQQIGKNIIDAAVATLEKSGRETHYLHQKFGQGASKPIDGADISNAVNILKKGGKINPEADEISPEDLDAAADYFDTLQEEDPQDVFIRGPREFGNDMDSRYEFIAYRIGYFPQKKQQIKPLFLAMTDAIEEGDKVAFDRAFVEAMKVIGHEDMLKEISDIVNNPKAGFMPDKILKSFIEDFEKASMSTGDIPYAQGEVIDAYKKTFPHMDKFIDLWLDQNHNKELKKFQNVADDPDTVGTDVMSEAYKLANGKMLDFSSLEANKYGDAFEYAEYTDGTKLTPAELDDLRDEEELMYDFFGPGGPGHQPGSDFMENDQMLDEIMNEIAITKVLVQEEIDSNVVASKLDAMQNDLEATLSDDEIDTLSDAIILLRQKKSLDEKVAVSNDPFLKALEAELAKILTDEEVNILTTLAKEQMNESPMAAGTGIKLATQYLLRRVLGPIILGPLVTKIFDKMATKFPEKKELILKMEPIVQGAIAAGKIGSMIELNKFIRANSEELSEMLVTMSSEMAAMLKDTVKGLVKRK